MPSKLRWFNRGVFMARDFSVILMHFSISSIEIVSNYPFFSTSLSSRVSYLFVVMASIVSWETPAPFCLSLRKQRRLAHSLDLLVVRSVWSFLFLGDYLRWFNRGVVMARDFSVILMHFSISSIEIVSNYPFFSTSLSSRVSYLFVVMASIVSWETPAPFCLSLRKQRRLAHSLDLLVVRSVWSFLFLGDYLLVRFFGCFFRVIWSDRAAVLF